ncbi:MAG: hypothetical protein JXR07_19090 [Reichenbachiella sp.]
MKFSKLIIPLISALALLLEFSCTKEQKFSSSNLIPNTDGINEWLLSKKLDTFFHKLESKELSKPSGLSNNDYLKVIADQVRVMQQYQDSEGRIIDPVEKEEKYYTTPCYAHSISVLASSGYTKDQELIESGMKALDNTCGHLQRQFAPGNHGDFFTYPVMMAIRHFKAFADSARYSNWQKIAGDIKPEKFYAFYNKYHINWNLVHASGEFLRYKEGTTDIHYVDSCLRYQKKHFTDYGLYNEWGNPLAYDLFSRHYLMGIFALGYDSEHKDEYKEILWKGAWMSLFMQSPTGELATGFRSSHHIWNEAEQAMIFEVMAQQYVNIGNEVLAGVFKRGAMLSLQSIKRWIRPDGSGYIVKNKFPIESKHGYEGYSVHSCYNMLATSMLAQAYEFAADVEEQISPSDVGGYVLPVLNPFHKIFASLNGTYIEYDTKGDQKYNPTGVLRVHLKNTNPQLGPSDGIASLWNTEEASFATGPTWQNPDGSWTSLAEQEIEPTEVKILEESETKVEFIVVYNTADSISIIENISIEDDIVSVKNSILGHKGNKRLTWPILVFDGIDKSTINVGEKSISVNLDGEGVQLTLNNGFNGEVRISEEEYNHRNGIAKIGLAEINQNEFTYTLSKTE